MLPRGRAGVSVPGYAGFAPPTENQQGNNNPAWTGSHSGPPDRPGPHMANQPIAGQTGDFDGFSGTDPDRPKRSPYPRVVAPVVEGASGIGDGPALGAGLPAGAGRPLGYAQGQSNVADDGISSNSFAARLNAPNRENLFPTGRQGWWRGGIQGFSDQLQVRDRHAYWEAGRQRFRGPGTETQLNGRNPQLDGPPMVTLKTVNISVNPQLGSPQTAFADDLTRPYTWLGQQDGSRAPIYGGVPGLWQAYGNRGFSQGIHDPSNGEGGPSMVYPGPPHGLHSDTYPDGKQLIGRYRQTPQMRPVRFDRPLNTAAAGQSYSQTVQFQGATGPAQSATSGEGLGLNFGISSGWKGRAPS